MLLCRYVASVNQALATIVIKNKIDGRTIPFVLAGRKLKAKAMTNLTNPQNRTHKSRGKVGRSINYCRRSPARISLNSFLSVLSRRYDFVGESFCKIRASFMLDRVLSKRGLPVEDCLSRIACRGLCIFLIICSLALWPFEAVTSCSISTRVRP